MQNILFYVKKNGKDLVIFLLILVCLIFLGYNYYLIKSQNSLEDNYYDSLSYLNNNVEKEEVQEQTITLKTLNIDVKGAIKNPGVYRVSTDAIINDVITLAGGFKSNAYTNGINLSKKVSDEMVIYVYTKDEIANLTKNKSEDETSNNLVSEEKAICKTPSYNIQECLDSSVSIIEVGITNNSSSSNASSSNTSGNQEESKTPTNTSKININTAKVSELTTLSGIGETYAQRIIEYREQNGDFKSIEDIKNVKGIGDALFEKIKDYITV